MAKGKTQSRREHLERMRAEQRRKERRTALLMWGVGGLVVLAVVGLVGFYVVNDRSEKSLSAVKTYDYKGSDHAWTKISYKENPPVGGQHNYYWQNCGIYDKPIHNEHGVHSLEHGAVWITYSPDLPAADVDKLKTLASSDYMLLSPYPGLPGKVVASSWNHQIVLDGASDPRLPEFIKKYKQNPTYTPEFGAACDQGVSTTADQPLPSEPTPTASPSAGASTEPTPTPAAS
ncbi:DUF3105 domain-containing protein [Planotetraspora mira]|uniref:DUF3105 domain-containing protein n=1 Tax=Planotetraspora mira TaxID=58121 RepID=A0A8J3X4D8_9ACTN|nr:DUF3105 domain-containing protein [Planotetraspora mira]GII26946.1 hypothetical protein Pmi06nite_03880 [Planotetraspora mira]